MRTVKASEVVKGMRIEYTRTSPDGVEVTVRGPVTAAPLTDFPMKQTRLALGDCGEFFHGFTIDPDHPVTVLAEPEPEWVEGAWYWVSIDGGEPFPLKGERHVDFQGGMLTVLGRVLIVDWPGDDVARDITRGDPLQDALVSSVRAVQTSFADAIRTQGGAR